MILSHYIVFITVIKLLGFMLTVREPSACLLPDRIKERMEECVGEGGDSVDIVTIFVAE